MEVHLYTDGASRGNPGPAGAGALLTDPAGNLLAEVSEPLGLATNNVAEYTALLRGLERALALGARRVRVFADSELMIRQLQGAYKVKNAGLLPLFQQARTLLRRFEEVSLTHVPREKNREADRLANQAIDGRPAAASRPAPRPASRPAPAPAQASLLDSPPPATAPATPTGRRVAFRQVDAFTDQPFAGNPAAIVLDATGLTDDEMQAIAREMNLSETAFTLPPTRPDAFRRVRFFTPQAEVDLCGHATVATFFTLAELGILRPAPTPAGNPIAVAVMEANAGLLPVEVHWESGRPATVMMGQAAPQFRPFEGDRAALAGILGLDSADLADAGSPADAGSLPIELAYTGLWHLIVPVSSLAVLHRLSPDMDRLAALNRALGVHTTHAFTLETVAPGATAHARAFGPAVGVREDPQTGTASGALGAYLVARGAVAPGRLLLEQGHVLGRPGAIRVEVEVDAASADGAIGAVRVGGRAVTVMSGDVWLPAAPGPARLKDASP